jgi:hypothetical protein
VKLAVELVLKTIEQAAIVLHGNQQALRGLADSRTLAYFAERHWTVQLFRIPPALTKFIKLWQDKGFEHS